ncbi:hypothetical protein sos41_03710 [Alphaproteobacteria bacterium SO-S41]|nr:hypothetical protein sos41_03710 [Alphaproteobacteria bacterium SO-S41]
MKTRSVALLTLAATVVAALGAAEAYDRRVRIKNGTGDTISSLTATSTTNGWSGQVLGGLAPGAATMATVDDGDGGCTYDFTASLAGGGQAQLSGVDVCAATVVVIQ